MTTADLRWTPAPAPSIGIDDLAEVDGYVGRHRKPSGRPLSIMRMMYRPRHRAR